MKAALIACLAASPAFATCPTEADLDQGIVLVQNEPVFIRADFDRTPEGLREVRLTRVEGTVESVVQRLSDHALAPAIESTREDRVIYSYDGALGDLDRLDDAGEIRFAVTARAAEGPGDTRQVLITYEGPGEATILGCTYETWGLREMRAAPDGTIDTRELTYAPDLGLVLAEARIGADGARRTTYDFTWIGTAADVAR